MTDDPLIGKRLSNFLILRVLGRGGMAQVYYGEDIKLQRPVAIKVIDARYRGKPAYAQRFVKEARSVARWRHENIIQIYYADDQDDLYYYVMEYIDGQDLASILSAHVTRGELLPDTEILRIGRAIASALDYAHSKGVIHRDVKPSNVFIAKDGRIVLGDFGLALDVRQGSLGEVFGSPHYVSPEQANRSTDAVPQSDIYSLGIILYEMLTGVTPFDDLSPTSVALQHITPPPPLPRSINPQINLETEEVLLKAISKKPQDRYQSGAALLDALEKALAHTQPVPERVLPLPPLPAAILAGKSRTATRKITPAAKPASKRRWPVMLLFAAILLIPGLFLGNSLSHGRLAALIFPPTPTSTPAPTATFTLTFTPLPTATATHTPTFTDTPSATATPSRTATFTPSPTSIASDTPTIALTDTLTAAATMTLTLAPEATASETPGATSTPASPGKPSPTTTQENANYKRLWLYYDSYGIYLHNASDANRSISPLAFERIDAAGNFLNRFDGWRWADFYPTLNATRCMRIEIQGNPNPYLNPAVCRRTYLSTRSIARDSDLIFWTEKPASAQFRVLWRNEEIARCEISAGFCEAFIP